VNKKWRKNLISVLIALYVLAAVGCLVVSDRAVQSLLTSIRVVNLSQETQSGRATIDMEVAALQQQVDNLKVTVATLERRTYPSLQELKGLETRHHLSIFQMERVTNPKEAKPGLLRYNAVVTGTVGSVVRFLEELERGFITQSDQVVIRPAVEDGSLVALGMTLLLREE